MPAFLFTCISNEISWTKLIDSCTAIAQDIMQTYFANDPYDKEAWAKYRREVLEYGGSHANELEMLTKFLGRPPNMNAVVVTLAEASQPS
jgi:metallopeptidase MepB